MEERSDESNVSIYSRYFGRLLLCAPDRGASFTIAEDL